MRIYFYTDPHFGLAKVTHTTPASRERLKNRLHQAASLAYNHDQPVICLGDFFDTESVSNADLIQAVPFWSRSSGILKGNHDSSNRTSFRSSYEVLNSMLPRSIDGPWVQEGVLVYSIPHQPTQEAFEAALDSALADRTPRERGILLLHCNYDSPFNLGNSSLNLTRDKAETLLDRFHYILIGHEHTSRSDFNGRLALLGSVFPTGFDNLTDKYYWSYDSESGALEPHQSWKADAAAQCSWDSIVPDMAAEFVEITGQAPRQEFPKIAASIANLWRNSPNLLMVKNSVTASDSLPEFTPRKAARINIPDTITQAVKGTDLEGIWESYYASRE